MIDALQAYPEYKATGIDWLGDIPNHWEVLRGRHLFEIKKRIADELGYPVISVTQEGLKKKNIETGEGQLAKDYSKYQTVKAGEFAMNSMDLITGGIGIANFFGVTSPDYRVFSIRDRSRHYSRYMLYVLRLLYQNRGFYAWGQGSAQLGRWRLPRKRFNDFPFPVPTFDEQKLITHFLSMEDDKIRCFIRNRRRLVEVLNEQKQRLIQSAITSSSTKLHRMRDLVTDPKRKVERVENQKYRPIGLYNWGRGIFHKPLTRGQDLGDSVFFWVEEGDLVFSGQFAWEGAVSFARRKDHRCIASHRYPIFISKSASIRTCYLESFFQSSAGHLLMDVNSRGAAGRNRPLNTRSLLREMIPVPDIEVQLEIEKFSNLLQRISDVFGIQIALIREFRTRLISDVVTGKVDVRHLAPPPGSEDLEESTEALETLHDGAGDLDEESLAGDIAHADD